MRTTKCILLAAMTLFTAHAFAGAKWVFVEKSMTWQAAVDGAPAGYHLPKRFEVLRSFDAGDIPTVNSQIWTASDRDEFKAWYVIISNKNSYLVSESKLNDKRNSQFVGYVRDAE
jgi:hypothetical protein